MPRRLAHHALLALVHVVGSQLLCEPYCSVEACADLNGQPEVECGACSPEARCHPGTMDQSQRSVPANDHVADCASDAPLETPERATSPPTTADVRPCQRVNASVLRSLSVIQRASLFLAPTLIDGLIDDWPVGRVAQHEFLHSAAHRNAPSGDGATADAAAARSVVGRVASRQDEVVLLRQARLATLAHFDFDGADPNDERTSTPARREAEAALLALLKEQFPTPDVLRRASAQRLLSFGDEPGMGVSSTVNHGFSWLGVLAGRKWWHLAPPDHPMPSDARCPERAAPPGLEVVPGTTHRCLQEEGEVMITPTAWWHSTCNVHAPGGERTAIVAIGGQVSWLLERLNSINPSMSPERAALTSPSEPPLARL